MPTIRYDFDPYKFGLHGGGYPTKKAAPAKRTRARIEGDLKAANREVGRLTAELAATPPAEIKVEGTVYGGRSVSLRRVFDGNCELRLTWTPPGSSVISAPNVFFTPAEAGELRDWLNHYFPKTEENA